VLPAVSNAEVIYVRIIYENSYKRGIGEAVEVHIILEVPKWITVNILLVQG
jgi:hypothetical protein